MIISCPAADAMRRYLDMMKCPKCKADMGFTVGTFKCPYCSKKSKLKPEPKTKEISYTKTKYKVLYYQSTARPNIKHRVYCTQKNVFVSCTCEGFTYRKQCRHRNDFENNQAKEAISNESS